MQVSVILCAHNEERRLGEQLDALVSQVTNREWELVVVDNRSTDRTVEIACEYASVHPRVRLVAASERADKSYAMSVGVASSCAELLAFCDGDDIVCPGWIDAIADGLEVHEVVTGPHELDLLNPRWLADSRGRSVETEATGTFVGLFPTLRGANWGVRRTTWDSLGGMRENCHPVEDLEFSFRCWVLGIQIVGVPQAVVHYRYRSTVAELWRQGYAYGSHRPMVARLVSDEGRARVPRFSGWRSWLLLVARFPSVATRQGRASWTWVLANRVGQVVGSIRYRVVML
ncbi:MAG: glycosyltransferase [Actinomycetota bacterium]|nr:glycosyltransferase [Actinomycetota bacterium]